jgi:pyridoxal phosphate enzyme (YggS family)
MQSLNQIITELNKSGVKLVAVSKTKPTPQIMEIYEQGQHIFGENRVPELVEKAQQMPKDIEWHMIGHLQRNKVKSLVLHVAMIHSIDNVRLLKEVNKQAAKINRVIPCLLQLKIAEEETKSGFDLESLRDWLAINEWKSLQHIKIAGMMGMASFVDDMSIVRREFKYLKSSFDQLKGDFFKDNDQFKEISMGMSGDYQIAIEEGSTMVRIGSLIFGPRNYG